MLKGFKKPIVLTGSRISSPDCSMQQKNESGASSSVPLTPAAASEDMVRGFLGKSGFLGRVQTLRNRFAIVLLPRRVCEKNEQG